MNVAAVVRYVTEGDDQVGIHIGYQSSSLFSVRQQRSQQSESHCIDLWCTCRIQIKIPPCRHAMLYSKRHRHIKFYDYESTNIYFSCQKHFQSKILYNF